MPQFDFYSFSGQVLWTLLGFSFFYFFILKYYIVKFSEVFKLRQKLYLKAKRFSKNDSVETYKKKVYSSFFKGGF